MLELVAWLWEKLLVDRLLGEVSAVARLVSRMLVRGLLEKELVQELVERWEREREG